ncbi:hypothetical protein KQX54_012553 [Cotesia glomerata]|uniref:Uncharacterized protein n=1 Tax=Cotesia glomerata TaxID=32391 RepID=A0AAV7HD09_COTGL|nr:hypothetical protein KQX54_012553 [Cotesia glomerata]
MNFQQPPFFRQGQAYILNGWVSNIFGYKKIFNDDHFCFCLRNLEHPDFDHVITIIDNDRKLAPAMELNKVVEVWAICFYSSFFPMNGNLFSFTFRSVSIRFVQVTSLFYEEESRTFEWRITEAEMDEDD